MLLTNHAIRSGIWVNSVCSKQSLVGVPITVMPSSRWFSLDTSDGYINLRGDSDTDDELVPCPAADSDDHGKTLSTTKRTIECDDDDVERDRIEISVSETSPLELAVLLFHILSMNLLPLSILCNITVHPISRLWVL